VKNGAGKIDHPGMLTGYQIQIIAEPGDLIVKLEPGRIGALQVQELGRHIQSGRDKKSNSVSTLQ
jgi:hypothetical protein